MHLVFESNVGQANPDDNFRFTTFNGTAGYVFNLQTKWLATGSYVLVFRAGADTFDDWAGGHIFSLLGAGFTAGTRVFFCRGRSAQRPRPTTSGTLTAHAL